MDKLDLVENTNEQTKYAYSHLGVLSVGGVSHIVCAKNASTIEGVRFFNVAVYVGDKQFAGCIFDNGDIVSGFIRVDDDKSVFPEYSVESKNADGEKELTFIFSSKGSEPIDINNVI